MDNEWHVIPIAGVVKSQPAKWLFTQWGDNPEIEDDDLVEYEEEAEIQMEGGPASASLMNSTRTISRTVPQEQSPSGHLFQRRTNLLRELSCPSMSIRSRLSLLSTSQKPLPPPLAPSLMSWTPSASLINSSQPSTSSPSRGAVRGRLKQLK